MEAREKSTTHPLFWRSGSSNKCSLTQARFDRHFVRDLTWSRHQLEELAERRFRAAQNALKVEGPIPGADPEAESTSFADLFKKARCPSQGCYLGVVRSLDHHLPFKLI